MFIGNVANQFPRRGQLFVTKLIARANADQLLIAHGGGFGLTLLVVLPSIPAEHPAAARTAPAINDMPFSFHQRFTASSCSSSLLSSTTGGLLVC